MKNLKYLREVKLLIISDFLVRLKSMHLKYSTNIIFFIYLLPVFFFIWTVRL
jgi:hypothetical protein